MADPAPARPGFAIRLGDTPNQDVLPLPAPLDVQLEHAAAELPRIAREALARSGVPGMAIAVVHDDTVVAMEGFGVREVDSDRAVTPDTVFQIASLSKPLSATGVAAAIGRSDGALSWTTPIHALLPRFEYSDPVVTSLATIGDAFSHRTGLATGAGDDLEDLGYDREHILDRLRLQPLDGFRASYHYSNFGITIGAEAVAASRAQAWEDLMDELVFGPLGMASTSSRHADYLAHTDRALLHTLQDGGFVAAFDRNPDPESPAGGVSSTVRDLARWMRMLLAGGAFAGRQLVDGAALAEAMTPHVVSGSGPGLTGRPSHYGFGFNVGPQVSGRMAMSHSGAFVLGAATNVQLVPELDLGIVVLTNGAPIGVPEAVTAQFLDLVQYGRVTRDWIADAARLFASTTAPIGDLVDVDRPAHPEPPPQSARLVGNYDNPYFGPLTIERGEDGLRVRLGKGGSTVLPLAEWDGPVFAYAPRNENAPWGSLASAAFGEDGATLRLTSLDGQGLGTWVRSTA